MTKKFVFFSVSFLVIFVLILLNVSVANPTSGLFYGFRRLYEKTLLSLKASPKDKLSYQYQLLDSRLAELTYIVENGVSEGVLTSSLRYSTTVGQIAELIIQNNLTDETQNAIDKFEVHILIVEDLLQKYNGASSETKFITDDINYLKTYVDLLTSFKNVKK